MEKARIELSELNNIKIQFSHPEDKAVIYEVFNQDVYRVGQIAEKATVIDVGAHIGTFALRCAKERNCTVYAYEPCSRNFQLLTQNIKLNHLENKVKAFNQAIGGIAGTRKVYFRPRVPHASSLYETNEEVEMEFVQCKTLRDVFTENSILRCHVLKMDCEGAEKEIFIPEFTACLRQIDWIMLEWHDSVQHDSYGRKYVDFLKNIGFDISELTGDGFTRGMLYARRL